MKHLVQTKPGLVTIQLSNGNIEWLLPQKLSGHSLKRLLTSSPSLQNAIKELKNTEKIKPALTPIECKIIQIKRAS
ncbi:MAG: hypothetical protein IPL20_03035 [Saprospiraceae bacterium]|nr:hypothetical protein [Saprospiraceae bacterium]